MSFKRFTSQGVLKYSVSESGYKLVLLVDDAEISRYYRSFVPKSKKCNPQRYASHVTIVRNEVPQNIEKWGAYENKSVEFEYESMVHYDGTYWWLDCYSSFLETLREELGLIRYSEWNSPPNGKACFHMTIGNSK